MRDRAGPGAAVPSRRAEPKQGPVLDVPGLWPRQAPRVLGIPDALGTPAACPPTLRAPCPRPGPPPPGDPQDDSEAGTSGAGVLSSGPPGPRRRGGLSGASPGTGRPPPTLPPGSAN